MFRVDECRTRCFRALVSIVVIACLGGFAVPVAADFDADNYPDLAISAIKKLVDGRSAGMVLEIDGGPDGITTDLTRWRQDEDLGSFPADGDLFGFALAIGDFDRDGWYDLAIGVPRDCVEAVCEAGAVHVLYGTEDGLTSSRNQFLHQGNCTDGSPAETDDLFGFSLVAADFDDDGYDDLAIGAPLEDFGSWFINAGAVIVVHGSGTGLDPEDSQWISHSNAGGVVEAEDRFGYALAAGYFNEDRFADLAIGAPHQAVNGFVLAGVVEVMSGSEDGLVDGPGNDTWHQDRSGIRGHCEHGDRFGSELAVGDFNIDGYDDLVVGVPEEAVESGGSVFRSAGVVHIIDGSIDGLTADSSQFFFQNVFDSTPSEQNDRFGDALAAGDFDGDHIDDLAIGAPSEDWGSVEDVGVVHILPGSTGGLVGRDERLIKQNDLLNRELMEAGDQFGFSLAGTNLDNDEFDDLVIGVPGETLGGRTRAGTVDILYGTDTGLSMDNEYVDECTARYGGRCERWDSFGYTVAAPPRRDDH